MEGNLKIDFGGIISHSLRRTYSAGALRLMCCPSCHISAPSNGDLCVIYGHRSFPHLSMYSFSFFLFYPDILFKVLLARRLSVSFPPCFFFLASFFCAVLFCCCCCCCCCVYHVIVSTPSVQSNSNTISKQTAYRARHTHCMQE